MTQKTTDTDPDIVDLRARLDALETILSTEVAHLLGLRVLTVLARVRETLIDGTPTQRLPDVLRGPVAEIDDLVECFLDQTETGLVADLRGMIERAKQTKRSTDAAVKILSILDREGA